MQLAGVERALEEPSISQMVSRVSAVPGQETLKKIRQRRGTGAVAVAAMSSRVLLTQMLGPNASPAGVEPLGKGAGGPKDSSL